MGCTTLQKNNISSSDEIEATYSQGKKIVVVSSPQCGFCQRAFNDFSSTINDFLKSNGVIIAPISRQYEDDEIESVLNWNNQHSLNHLLSYNDTKLKHINLRSTPQFYFFNNGHLVEKIVGWPRDKSNGRAIEKAIKNLNSLK